MADCSVCRSDRYFIVPWFGCCKKSYMCTTFYLRKKSFCECGALECDDSAQAWYYLSQTVTLSEPLILSCYLYKESLIADATIFECEYKFYRGLCYCHESWINIYRLEWYTQTECILCHSGWTILSIRMISLTHFGTLRTSV